MTKEVKTNTKVDDIELKPNESNTRAMIIVIFFIALFVGLIAYEVVSRK